MILAKDKDMFSMYIWRSILFRQCIDNIWFNCNHRIEGSLRRRLWDFIGVPVFQQLEKDLDEIHTDNRFLYCL